MSFDFAKSKMLSQNQTAGNKKNQKVCDNQNQSQNQRKIIKKRLLVVHTHFGTRKGSVQTPLRVSFSM